MNSEGIFKAALRDVPMTSEEIKIRRLTNQYLIKPADKITVVRDLCGIQTQCMANAMHSLKIRFRDFDEQTAADGLVKNWTLRGTVHVFAESDLPLFLHCNNGTDYLSNEWNGQTFWNQRDRWALSPERQKYFSEVIVSSVSQAPLTRDELKEICRAHGMTDSEEGSMFDPWGGCIRQLCERGFMNYVVQEKKAYCSPRNLRRFLRKKQNSKSQDGISPTLRLPPFTTPCIFSVQRNTA